MKRIALIVSASMILILMTGCFHSHTWVEATCTSPKTCTECGEIEGEPAGHKWIEATCLTAKTCEVCGETPASPCGRGCPCAPVGRIDARLPAGQRFLMESET